MKMNGFWKATFTLVGMIIGVGMFGIPRSFVFSGFWLGVLELVVLSAVVLGLHLLYAEVVLETEGHHRLPGYARLYLGRNRFRLAIASAFLGISGSLLAYLIVGSVFLQNIFGFGGLDAPVFFWVLVLAILGAAADYFPLKKESLINGVLTAGLLIFAVFLLIYLLPYFQAENLSGFDLKGIAVPYGVLLFSLSGGLVIPEVVSLVGRNRRAARRAIMVGTLIPAVVYFLFAAAVLGSVGAAVSDEAITSLKNFAGGKIVTLGSLVGFLAIFTSLISANKNFQNMFQYDLGFSKKRSWLLVSLIPLALYILGFKNFLAVIGVVGALGVGVDSLLIIWCDYRMKRNRREKTGVWSRWWRAAVWVMITGGVLYELYKFFG